MQAREEASATEFAIGPEAGLKLLPKRVHHGMTGQRIVVMTARSNAVS